MDCFTTEALCITYLGSNKYLGLVSYLYFVLGMYITCLTVLLN